MSKHVTGGYFPIYPQHDGLPDPDIRTFITNFYRTSDNPAANELWVSYFTKDATDARGTAIREMRGRMWTTVDERKHTVTKIFPGMFQGADASRAPECECMLFGEVQYRTKDGGAPSTASWAGHGTLRKEKNGEHEEWKFAQYRVWLQK
ncbi:hypothetical protein S40285_07726 [Stachybotrys chlorohalonatus IBT 40285]|uniref:SnoaL-like domain-containing protein n=1 Tax=Stachybotrys chlorohalonatus (strain IBT 40285) TaxID=1283841 RepID=A0A084QE48_STAC4|nr:hypothetical protein S40285_07726 [Stachybotrys chlorohalonata IBT 40285]